MGVEIRRPVYGDDERQFASDVIDTVQPRFDRRGIRLVCDDAAAAGRFTADPGLLNAALVNLLENAVDACAAGSRALMEGPDTAGRPARCRSC